LATPAQDTACSLPRAASSAGVRRQGDDEIAEALVEQALY